MDGAGALGAGGAECGVLMADTGARARGSGIAAGGPSDGLVIWLGHCGIIKGCKGGLAAYEV